MTRWQWLSTSGFTGFSTPAHQAGLPMTIIMSAAGLLQRLVTCVRAMSAMPAFSLAMHSMPTRRMAVRGDRVNGLQLKGVSWACVCRES